MNKAANFLRIHKFTVITVLVLCAFVLYSPMLFVSAASFSTDAEICQSIDDNITEHDNSHACALPCHIHSCCTSMNVPKACNFGNFANMDKSFPIYEENIYNEDLIGSIFKPPQF